VSCAFTSKIALLKITPVTPPKVNIKIKPITQDNELFNFNFLSDEVNNQVKTLIPVGMAITIVAAVK